MLLPGDYSVVYYVVISKGVRRSVTLRASLKYSILLRGERISQWKRHVAELKLEFEVNKLLKS